MGRRRARARATEQSLKIGREIRNARTAIGLSRADAARRGGVSRSTWDRLENGSVGASVGTLSAVTDAVGLDLVLRAYPGIRPSLRDRGQMAIAQQLAAIAHPGWTVSLEVTAGDHGQAVDEVFTGAAEILATEIIRHMGGFEGQYRAASIKRDWLQREYRRPVRLVLAIEDLPSNRASLAPHSTLVRTVFPAESRAVLAALRSGQPLGSDGLLWVRRPRERGRADAAADAAATAGAAAAAAAADI